MAWHIPVVPDDAAVLMVDHLTISIQCDIIATAPIAREDTGKNTTPHTIVSIEDIIEDSQVEEQPALPAEQPVQPPIPPPITSELSVPLLRPNPKFIGQSNVVLTRSATTHEKNMLESLGADLVKHGKHGKRAS